MDVYLSPFAPENLASRDRFGSPVPIITLDVMLLILPFIREYSIKYIVYSI